MEKIGRGKYSDVYKCINNKTDKLAVVKVLKPGNPNSLPSTRIQNQEGNQNSQGGQWHQKCYPTHRRHI